MAGRRAAVVALLALCCVLAYAGSIKQVQLLADVDQGRPVVRAGMQYRLTFDAVGIDFVRIVLCKVGDRCTADDNAFVASQAFNAQLKHTADYYSNGQYAAPSMEFFYFAAPIYLSAGQYFVRLYDAANFNVYADSIVFSLSMFEAGADSYAARDAYAAAGATRSAAAPASVPSLAMSGLLSAYRPGQPIRIALKGSPDAQAEVFLCRAGALCRAKLSMGTIATSDTFEYFVPLSAQPGDDYMFRFQLGTDTWNYVDSRIFTVEATGELDEWTGLAGKSHWLASTLMILLLLVGIAALGYLVWRLLPTSRAAPGARPVHKSRIEAFTVLFIVEAALTFIMWIAFILATRDYRTSGLFNTVNKSYLPDANQFISASVAVKTAERGTYLCGGSRQYVFPEALSAKVARPPHADGDLTAASQIAGVVIFCLTLLALILDGSDLKSAYNLRAPDTAAAFPSFAYEAPSAATVLQAVIHSPVFRAGLALVPIGMFPMALPVAGFGYGDCVSSYYLGSVASIRWVVWSLPLIAVALGVALLFVFLGRRELLARAAAGAAGLLLAHGALLYLISLLGARLSTLLGAALGAQTLALALFAAARYADEHFGGYLGLQSAGAAYPAPVAAPKAGPLVPGVDYVPADESSETGGLSVTSSFTTDLNVRAARQAGPGAARSEARRAPKVEPPVAALSPGRKEAGAASLALTISELHDNRSFRSLYVAAEAPKPVSLADSVRNFFY